MLQLIRIATLSHMESQLPHVLLVATGVELHVFRGTLRGRPFSRMRETIHPAPSSPVAALHEMELHLQSTGYTVVADPPAERLHKLLSKAFAQEVSLPPLSSPLQAAARSSRTNGILAFV